VMEVLRLQKRPIAAVRGCMDRRKRTGGRERDLRINGGGAIIESVYAYARIMAGPFGAN